MICMLSIRYESATNLSSSIHAISQIWTFGLIIWWFQSDSSIIGLPLLENTDLKFKKFPLRNPQKI